MIEGKKKKSFCQRRAVLDIYSHKLHTQNTHTNELASYAQTAYVRFDANALICRIRFLFFRENTQNLVRVMKVYEEHRKVEFFAYIYIYRLSDYTPCKENSNGKIRFCWCKKYIEINIDDRSIILAFWVNFVAPIGIWCAPIKSFVYLLRTSLIYIHILQSYLLSRCVIYCGRLV